MIRNNLRKRATLGPKSQAGGTLKQLSIKRPPSPESLAQRGRRYLCARVLIFADDLHRYGRRMAQAGLVTPNEVSRLCRFSRRLHHWALRVALHGKT